MMFRIFSVLAIALLVFLAILATRTYLYGKELDKFAPITDVSIDQQEAAKRLSGALAIKTISRTDVPVAADAFKAMHQYLENTFPLTHENLERETVNEYSLLYTWRGDNLELEPILLMAHMDVVPIAAETVHQWKYPPFSGKVADGFIWGRGALDMKQSLMGIMEAVEYLLVQKLKPDRTVYLAFGHDEEVGGYQGAAKIAELLESRNIKLNFTLDEGSAIVQGILPGISPPVALVGMAEKGAVTLKLTAFGPGGHGSMPPANSAIVQLARAIDRLETNQMPAEVRYPVSAMFEYLASEMPLSQRVVIANRWLFERLLTTKLETNRATNAAIRTTTAITVLKAGTAYNVFPTTASALGTFRILPGDSIEMVIDHVRRIVGSPNIEVEVAGRVASEPSRVSSTESSGFATIAKTIRQVSPDTIVAPSLVVTGTDSPHYEKLAENSFRFVPMRIKKEDIERIHGIDERVGVANYAEIIRFYVQLIRNVND